MPSRPMSRPLGSLQLGLLVCLVLAGAGCGQLKSYQATEQLLLSGAVDEAVQKLDFSPLSGKKVFVDTTYVKDGKTYGFVHDGYLISSVRQRMMADGCLLYDKKEEADVIVEARVGTLGADAHEVTYGLPASSALSSAATAMGSPAPIPTIPEISVAKKTQNDGAAKLALFAFDAKTHEPLWQSGVSLAKTTSANTWLFGAGPWPRKRWGWRIWGEGKPKEETKQKAEDEKEDAFTKRKVAFDEAYVFPALRRSSLELEKGGEMIAQEESKPASARLVDDRSAEEPPAGEQEPNEGDRPVEVARKNEPPQEKEPAEAEEERQEKRPAKHTLASSAAVGQ